MLDFSLDLTRFEELAQETVRVMGTSTVRAIGEGVDAGAAHARHTHVHKTRTGRLTSPQNLRGRIVSANELGAVGEIRNDTPYVRFVEYPTRPHVIEAVNAQALRFKIGNRTVFAKRVQHPGTPGFPFMEPAGDVAVRQIIYETENVTFVLAAALWT